MALVIREGDPTTTGGIVVAGSSANAIEYRKAARISDPVWCPACKSMGFIAEGNPTVIDEYVALATHGHAVKCGCPFGSNRLIATQSTVMAAEDVAVSIAPDLAAKAEAATQVWAQAIRTGSYQSAFTSSIPGDQVRGLATTQSCVFAKSCLQPAGSIEAGTAAEPSINFGKTAVLGTTGAIGPGGTVALGRVAGQIATEGLGSWALRGLGTLAGSAVATASTVLLAFWPSDIGDQSLYSADDLRSLSAAATRIRFQFRKATDGILQVYGIHTSRHSGMESVPVVQANWAGDRSSMEAQLGGITIIWTPNTGPIVTAPTTYPGVTGELENIFVRPIEEGTDSELEIYPAEDDITWQDAILVFPADSGIPPLYLVFAKPMVNPLEVGIHKDLAGRSKGDGMDIDHIPSQKALESYISSFDGVRPDMIADYLAAAPSIAIPRRVHQKYSETYGGRNTKAKQATDAADLRAAVDSNFDAIKKGLLAEGFAEADIEAARAELHTLHQEQGWY